MEQLSGEIQFQLVNYLIMHQAHVYHNSKSLHFKQRSNANANLQQSIGFHTFFSLKYFCRLFWLAKIVCTATGTYNHIVWTEYKSRQQYIYDFWKNRHQFFASFSICLQ